MAYEESLRSISLDADGSLAVYTGVPGQPGSADPNYGQQYRFVRVTGVNQVGLAGAADTTIGVLQNKPQVVGQSATVAIRGVSNMMSGGAITAGDLIGGDANGRAVGGGVAGSERGVALTTVTGANQLVVVLLRIN